MSNQSPSLLKETHVDYVVAAAFLFAETYGVKREIIEQCLAHEYLCSV